MATVNQPNHGHQAVIVPPPVRIPCRTPRVVPPPFIKQQSPSPPTIITRIASSAEGKIRNFDFKKIIKPILVIVPVILALWFTKAFLTPQYKVDTSIDSYSSIGGRKGYILTINVKGRAKKLVVLFTNRANQTATRIIERDSLFDGQESVFVSFASITKGRYKIIIKDYETEKVLATKYLTIDHDFKKQKTDDLL